MSKARERQKARRMLVQALYSWEVHADNKMSKVDDKLFHAILFGVPKNLTEVDGTFEPFLDRDNKQLDPVSRAVLRLSTFEMIFSIDVPYKVVINEGVNLAKTYGPTDAFKFINGVLDQVAIVKRGIEIKADRAM
jgi:N utilization substance protein B